MMLKGNWQLGIKTVGRLMDPDALLFYEFFAPSQKIQKGVLLIFQKVPQFKNRLGKKNCIENFWMVVSMATQDLLLSTQAVSSRSGAHV